MIYRRMIYSLGFSAVLLFLATNENYLAQFLFCLWIALPLLSLALSLYGMLGCRLELSAAPTALDRGGDGWWLVSVQSPNVLPLSRITVQFTGENLLTGQKEQRRLTLSGISRRRPVGLAIASTHCGLLELRVDRARVYDYLGLISFSVTPPQPARVICRPLPVDTPLPSIPEGQGVRTSPVSAARQGPGEDCDLRDYRPGDPMRSVHWKLSSKWDELIVRERAETLVPLPLLTLDRFGPPELLDRLLDRLLGMSRALLCVQRAHAILWLDRDGQPRLHAISDEKQLTDCLLDLLGTFAPLSGPSLADHPELLRGPDGPVFCLPITPEGGDSHG